MIKVNQNKAQEVVKEWSKCILTELTTECITWLGQNYSKLSNDVMNTLITHIAQVHSRGANEVTEEEANKYKLFMDSLNIVDVNSEHVKQHLQQVYSRISQNYNNPNNYLYRILPAVIKKMQVVPKNVVGQTIYTLFANTRGQTTLYGWLHLKFAQYWPNQDPEYTNYNPQQIFNETKAFLDNYSSAETSYGCLRSMSQMIKRGIVGDNSINLLMVAASKVWNNHREDAVETILEFTQLPDTSILCNLADSLIEEDTEAVLRVWKHAASHANNDYIYDMSNRILAKQPINWKSEMDVTLTLWISVLSDPAQLLFKLVTDNSLNIDQRKRVWAQIKKSYRLLGADFFLKHLKDIVASYQDIEGIRDILKSDLLINELFPSVKEKNLLSIVLLECFILVDSIELKNSFALWIQKNGGSSILGKLKELPDPSDDDLEVLKQHFPDSKKLAKFIS